MKYNTIVLEIKDNICSITLNRPPVNAINLGMREEIDHALSDLEKRDDVRVIVITGSGDKAFSAGMDLKDVSNINNGPNGSDLWTRIDRFPRPVIAAINGFALGGGCELALACHFRFMVDNPDAKIGLTELNLGIIPGWGGTQRMTRLVGRSKAMELIMFSIMKSPKEALEIGLVDRIFDKSELMRSAMDFAGKLAKRPPVAVQYVLRSILTGLDEGFERGLEFEKKVLDLVSKTDDAKEGITAFLEKREPLFRGS